ncbi:unnamed protein product [marine sediment metagenome]|uniref:Uncharacterized protein n=1 Tax=marine sediment metagenome TaxID=412755 RepID=X1D459_9ZZZZ
MLSATPCSGAILYFMRGKENNDLDNVKERYKFFCEIIPGLYKWKEKTVFIKIEEKYNFGLLLVELLHAKSVTQGHSYIKSCIREGLPHFLAKILSVKCEIHYEGKRISNILSIMV